MRLTKVGWFQLGIITGAFILGLFLVDSLIKLIYLFGTLIISLLVEFGLILPMFCEEKQK